VRARTRNEIAAANAIEKVALLEVARFLPQLIERRRSRTLRWIVQSWRRASY
jgi:hypothetical protein